MVWPEAENDYPGQPFRIERSEVQFAHEFAELEELEGAAT